MTYEETERLTKGLKRAGMRLDLLGMRAAMKALGEPQTAFDAVHVAGTNGKGSVCRMLEAIFSAFGLRCGTYTSPAVTGNRDTIRISGEPISRESFAECAEAVHRAVPQGLTEFEFITSLAFLYFARERVDLAVIECGMGGRDDATNVLPPPRAAVFTPIALDHTAFLGSTVAEIARVKSGIAKPPCPMICAPTMDTDALDVLMTHAAQGGQQVVLPSPPRNVVIDSATLRTRFAMGDLTVTLPLLGRHQAENAVLAIETAKSVLGNRFDLPTAVRALSNVVVPCRQEVIQRDPLVIADGAHNPHGVHALCDTLDALALPKVTLVIGMLRDKAVSRCLALLAPFCERMICTTPVCPDRALEASRLAELAEPLGVPVAVQVDLALALRQALETSRGRPVVAAGSFYTAGPARRQLMR